MSWKHNQEGMIYNAKATLACDLTILCSMKIENNTVQPHVVLWMNKENTPMTTEVSAHNDFDEIVQKEYNSQITKS